MVSVGPPLSCKPWGSSIGSVLEREPVAWSKPQVPSSETL
jgi:hypothetical protein